MRTGYKRGSKVDRSEADSGRFNLQNVFIWKMMQLDEISKYSFILAILMISGKAQNRNWVSVCLCIGWTQTQLAMNNHGAITLHLEARKQLLDKWKR